MSAAKRTRKVAGAVIVMPKAVFRTPEYWALSHRARSLLTALHLDYNLKNNGTLRLLFNKPKDYGFGSKSLLGLARDELLLAGWIEITRQGTKHTPTLYALTWLAVNADDKEGVRARAASNLWRAERAGDRDTYGKKLPERKGRAAPQKQILIPDSRESDSREPGVKGDSDSREPGLSVRFARVLTPDTRERLIYSHVGVAARALEPTTN